MPRLTSKILLEAIDKHNPKSVGSLRESLRKEGVEFNDDDLTELVRGLADDGIIVLGDSGRQVSFASFLAENSRIWWLYGILLVCLVESFLVVYDSQHPLLVTVRALLGLGLLGYLPGYAVTRVFFAAVQFPFLERLVLSIFLSVMLSIGIGTLLGAFFLFQSVTNVLLLASATLLLSFVGSYRAFRIYIQSSEESSRGEGRKRGDLLGPIPVK